MVPKIASVLLRHASRAPRVAERPTLHPWHAQDLDSVYRRLDCGPHGLSVEEATARLAVYGPNRLPEEPPVPAWTIFLRQFKSPLIYILLIAAAVSTLLGMIDDAIFILGVLLLNAVIGHIQESKAEHEIRSLGQLLVSRSRVQRSGRTHEVDSAELVPGDVVWLESGAKVAADMRLIESRGLRVDQSLLTGESMPVEKHPGPPLPFATPPSDQATLVFSGSSVFRGRGWGLVVGTGLDTQVGLIAQELHQEQRVKPPLLIRMERFTRTIAILILGLSAVVFVMGLWRGDAWGDMLMAALALSVSAIPEGLPVALTVALAIGVNRMARRNVLVRRLEAVEALGSCSVIGSDKTGTLTTNQLTVVEGYLAGEPFRVTGVGFEPSGEVLLNEFPATAAHNPFLHGLARAGALCNEAMLIGEDGWHHQGDPTDLALLVLAHKAGLDPGALNQDYPRTNAIPFEPERQFAASYHLRPGSGGLTVVKGAPEKVVAMCDHLWLADRQQRAPVVPSEVSDWVGGLTAEGYRVLAIAEDESLEPMPADATPEQPSGLTLLGLVGMIDPPREGVPEAIATCHLSGMRVVMITGDHLQTARIIANRIGLLRGSDVVIDGPSLEQLSDDALQAQAHRFAVIGRATPLAKLRVIKALQAAGAFVAVTGDGVNDAPALRAANIGVAMGRGGTDVAREASDLVLTDDDFASIVAGVEEGRVAYENVRKVIYLLISTGLGEVLAVILAMFFALPVPFLPAQLLWLNLVTNGVQDVALAFEPKEGDILNRPPRLPGEGIFNRIMIERTVLACLVFGGVSFGMYVWLLREGYSVEQARNLMLNLFVAFEILHLGNSRSETRSLFLISPFSNRVLLLGTLSAMLAHLGALYWPPMQSVLGATMPTLQEWAVVLGLAFSIVGVMELHKLARNLLSPLPVQPPPPSAH